MSDIPQLELGFPFEDSLNGVRTSLQHIKNELNAIDRASVAGVKKQLSNLNTSMLQLTSVVESLSQSVGKQLSDAGKVGAEGFSNNVKAGLEKAKAVGKKAAAEIAQEVGAEIKKATASGPFDLGANGIREASKETLKAVKGHYDAFGFFVSEESKTLADAAQKSSARALMLDTGEVRKATQHSLQQVKGHYDALGFFISEESKKIADAAQKSAARALMLDTGEVRKATQHSTQQIKGHYDALGFFISAESKKLTDAAQKSAARALMLDTGEVRKATQHSTQQIKGHYDAFGFFISDESRRLQERAKADAARMDKAWERIDNPSKVSDAFRSLQAPIRNETKIVAGLVNQGVDQLTAANNRYYAELERVGNLKEAIRQRLATKSVGVATSQPQRMTLDQKDAKYAEAMSALRDFYNPQSAPAPTNAMSESFSKAAAKARLLAAGIKNVGDEKERARQKAQVLRDQMQVLKGSMHEAHSAARGLAAGFNAMWLTWGSTAPLMIGAAISTSFVQASKSGMEFYDTMNRIKVLSGETSETMSNLSQKALELGAASSHGPQKMADAMKTLSLAGFNVSQIDSAIETVSRFATVGGTDLNESAEGLVAIATAYGYAAEDFKVVADVVAATANGSMASVESMTESFRQASVVAQQYGVSLRDTALILGLLSQIGIKGSAAGTAMRNMYTELMGTSKKARDVLKNTLGLEVWNEATSSMKSFSTIIGDMITSLSTKTSKAQQAILMALGNERGTKPMAAAISAELRKLGTVSVGASEMVDRLGLALKNLGNKSLTQKISPQLEEMKKQFAATGQVSANSMRDMQERIQAELEKPGVNAAAKAQAAQIAEDYKKSSSLATTAMKEFSKMLEESPGYTALIQFDLKQSTLEQTKQAISTLQTSLITAFASAEPALNNLVRLLKSAAGSDEFKSSVSAVVTVMAELGRVLVSNAGLIATLATAYVGLSATLSVVAGAGAWLNRVKAGWALVAVGATKASWGLSGAYTSVATTATAGATAGAALSTSMGRVAAGAGLAAAGLRGILAALGPISIALSIGAGLWIAWKNAKDAASAPTSVGNSLDLLKATNEEINQEIENINRVRKARTEAHSEALAQQKAQAETAKVRKAEAAAPGFLKGAKDLHEAQEALRKHEERWGNGNKMAGAGAAARLKELNARVSTAQENLRVLNQELATVFDGYDRIVEVSKLDAKEAEEAAAARSPKPKGTEGFDPDARSASADRDRIERARKVRDNELAMLQKSYQTEASLLESSLNTQKTILDNARSAMAVTEGSYMAQELTLQTKHETSSIEQAQAHLTEYTAAFLEALEDRQNAYNEFVAKNQGKKGFAEAQQQEKDALEQDLVNKAREFSAYYEQVTAGIAKTQDALSIRSAKLVSEAAGAANKYKKALEDQSRSEKRRLEDANSRAQLERAAIGLSERAITAMQAEFEERRRVAELARGYEDDLREAQKAEIQYIEEVNRLQDGGQWTDAQVLGLTLLASKSKAAAAALDEVNSGLEAGVDNAKKLALFDLETKQIAKLTDDLAGAVMTALQEGGDKGAEALRKVLVAELSKPISLIVKAFVQPIAQTVSSVSGGLSNVVGNFLNGGSIDEATAGLKDVMGAVSMGTNTAISVASSLTSFNAKIISKFGTSIATEAMGNFAAGMSSAWSLESAKTAFEAGGAQIGGLVVGSVMNGFTGYALSKMISNGYEVNKYMNKIGAAASMIPGVGLIAGGISGTINRAFGRKLADTGIEGTFGTSDGFDGNSYEFYKGGWLRSDKTKRKALDPQLEDMLEGTFNYAKIEMGLLATSVGLGVDSLDNFTKSIKVSFKGLSSEEASKRLEEEFQKVRESMADAVLGTKEYSQVGETSLETLERLSTAISSINPVFELLGYNMFQTSLAGASAADMLAQKFGGVDAATQALASYYDNYYSEFERNSAALKQVQGAFERLGVSMPALTTDLTGLATNGDEARKQFRGLVDAARAAGDDDLFVGLMNLQSAFLSLTPSTQEAAKSVEAVANRLASLAGSVVTSAGLTSVGASSTALEQARNALGAVSGKPAAVVTAEKALAERQALQTTLAEIYASTASGVSSAAEKVRAANDYHTKHEGGVYSSISGKAENGDLALQLTGNKNEAYDLVGRSNEAIDSSLDVLDQVVAAANQFAAALGVTNTVDVNAGFSVRANKNSNSYAQILLNGQVVDSIDQGRGGDSGEAFSDFVNEIQSKVFKAVLQGAYSSVDEVLSDGFLIAQKNYVTEVTSAWDKATAKSAEALQELATALTPLLEEQASLGIALLRAQGNDAAANAAERTKYLGEATAGLSESASAAVTAAYDYNRELERQIAFNQALKDLKGQAAEQEAALLRAYGDNGRADALETQRELADMTRGLTEAQRDSITVAYNYRKELERQAATVTERRSLEGQLLELADNQSEIRRRELQVIQPANRGLQTMVWRIDDLKDGISDFENSVKDFRDIAKGLRTTASDLLVSDSSPLTPSEKYAKIKEELTTTSALAASGDKAALESLSEISKSFLEMSRGYNASGSAYTEDFNLVQKALAEGAVSAEAKADVAQLQLDATKAQIQAASELAEALRTLTEALQDKLYAAGSSQGPLTLDEFKEGFKGLASEATLTEVFRVLDVDGDNTLSLLESIKVSSAALVASFGTFAVDTAATLVGQAGGLSTSELSAALGGGKDTLASLQTASAIDFDSSGVVTQVEADLAKLVSAAAGSYASTVSTPPTQSAAPVEVSSELSAVYRELLGRDVDSSGAAYYANQPIGSVVASIKASQEYALRNSFGASAQNLMNDLVNAQLGSSNSTKAFSSGGYTGHGGKYEVAGVVHRGEIVFSQDDIAALGGVGEVESIRRRSKTAPYRGFNQVGSFEGRAYTQRGGDRGSSADRALLEELKALRVEVTQLREQNNAGHSLNAQATTRNAQTVAGSVEKSSSKSRYAAKLDRKVSLV